MPAKQAYLFIVGLILTIGAGLFAYSQSWAYASDEGFHLLAAQLILNGKRPYLDFLFPQAPLNAYWNAMWMGLLGQSWHVPHGVAAVVVTGALFLTVDYAYRRLPEPRWRILGALFVGVAMGLNILIVQFGMVQAYGLCLLLVVAAWRATVAAVERTGLLWPALAGLASGAATEATLLSAAIPPVLLLWMVVTNRAGNRVLKFIAFGVAALAAWIPVLLFLIQAPKQVIFGIFTYHMQFREVEWTDWQAHNLGVALSWIDNGQSLLLILLAAAGLLCARRSDWARSVRAELYLCAWLTLAECLHLFNAHPTFSRYFLLVTPFLGILAAVGLCFLGERLSLTRQANWAVGVACLLMLVALGNLLFGERDDFRWSNLEKIAAKVDEVTPRGAPIAADESIYFLTRRMPPSGMEVADAHKLNQLTPQDAAALQVLPRKAMDQMVKSGAFKTFETCDDDPIDRLGLDKLYSNKAKIEDDCSVFWGWR